MTILAIIAIAWLASGAVITVAGLVALNIAERRMRAETARLAAIARAGNVIQFPAA